MDTTCIVEKLEDTRRRLLDLTRSNRLLNHRTRGQRTLCIFDELPEQIYRILVEEGLAMQFLSREEAPPEIAAALPAEADATAIAGAAAADLPPSLPLAPMDAGTGPAARHADRFLQTLLSGEKLQSRLVNLAREATAALAEQGHNILYLTLGMVNWQDNEPGSPICRAPLLFVPTELQRKNVQSRYSIRLFDDEILVNPCLVELCQRQFAFELPSYDSEAEAGLNAYFEAVGQKIREVSGWSFAREIHLGLFSFSKLLMYRDLDPRSWPENRKLTEHPLIQRMAGADGEPAADGDGIPDPATLDQAVSPNDCYQVVDADSSQQSAILAAKRGLSMVIDGPPGTGKSQTITNIIAECLAEGRTVLFVSEKSAALEVVKRRLEQVGLGDFVLELHSRKSSKRLVLQELQRVLGREDALPPVREVEAQELASVRQRLNDYQRQLHDPLMPLDCSPFQALSHAIALAGEAEAECQVPDVLGWSSQQLLDADEKLQTLDRRLARVGDPQAHPWRGAGIVPGGLEGRQRIRAACQLLASAITAALEKMAALHSVLGVAPVPTPAAARRSVEAGRILLQSPRLPASQIVDARWDAMNPKLQAWLTSGLERQQQMAVWSGHLRPEAEAEDWQDVLQRRQMDGSSWTRLFKPSWYRDGKRIKSFLLAPGLPPLAVQVAMLQALVKSNRLRRIIEEQQGPFGELFGPLWLGPGSDWPMLLRYAQASVAVRQLVLRGDVAASAGQRLAESDDRPALAQAVEFLETSLAALDQAWRQWLEALNSDEKRWLGGSWEQASLPEVSQRLASLPPQLELLQDWVDLQSSLQGSAGSPLAAFVAWSMQPAGQAARGRLATTFQRHFYRLWIDAAFARRPALQGFRGEDHQALIERFRELDTRWLQASRHRLAALIAARRPDMNHSAQRHSKLGILQAEIRKKARHMPLRKLFASVGDVVQSIKPCFMMSPLSVSQYLAPGGSEFDVVVFDEASQVEPADAYGAIARGRQLLLVGDEKQLPPTSFFSRNDSGGDQENADEFQVADLESILSLGIVRLPHHCGLRWHYRSRHASLIEFSNQKFYDGRLRIFPSPHTDCREMGLAFRYVENAVYKRGAGRFNPVEAQTVALAVVEHALNSPHLSLGVGTLNLPQQQAIEDEVERLRRTAPDPRLEQFFQNHEHEPFFVKNLESIQGDERDVIFLSVGYGRDENGRFFASFGPLNAEGGWRRLNVLVTRARQRCIVYSSIHADDINLSASPARGVVALKEYLYAAEHGRLAETPVCGGDHQSLFEAQVCSALRDRGWDVHAQVGAAGFWIDLAVVDPRRPGRYLLGVERDGATYHSSPTARDRDRLRQSVLEKLGWRLHRVWSTDWFNRPLPTLEKLLKRLDELKDQPIDAAAPAAPPPPTPAPTADIQPEPPNSASDAEPASWASRDAVQTRDDPDAVPEGLVPYEREKSRILGDQAALLKAGPRKLAEIICQLVQTEGPLHVEEMMHVVTERYSTRISPRSKEAIERALELLFQEVSIRQRGDFLWKTDMEQPPLRFRGNGCPVTRPDLIPPEEYELAIRQVLARELGLDADSLVAGAIRLMGFKRGGVALRGAVQSALDRLVESGQVVKDNAGFLVLSDRDPDQKSQIR